MISEIQTQIKRIEGQIESERRIHDSWAKYMDCDFKTKVIHQSIGVIRGLEVAKESLEFLLKTARPPEQMTTDEWLIQEQQIQSQINRRDGMVGEIREIHHPDGSREIQFPDGSKREYTAQMIDNGMAGRL